MKELKVALVISLKSEELTVTVNVEQIAETVGIVSVPSEKK